MEIKIDHNVPMPKAQRREGKSKYPFSQMAVGDSFKMAGNTTKIHDKVRAALQVAQKKTGFRFATRTNAAGIGVWRTK